MMKKTRFLCFLLALLGMTAVQAQSLSEYTLTRDTDDPYTSIASAANLLSVVNGDNDGLVGQASASTAKIPLPFNFPFGDTTFAAYNDTLYVRCDGYVYFRIWGGTGYHNPGNFFGSYNACLIAPFTVFDGQITANGATSGAYYAPEVDASGDTVAMLIEYKGLQRYNQTSSNYNWQLRLGADGSIKATIGTCTPYTGLSGSEVHNIILTHGPLHVCLTGSWDNPMLDTPASIVNLGIPLPSAGTSYTFSRPTNYCPRPFAITFSNIDSASADVSWTAGDSESEWAVYVNGVWEANVTTTSYSLSNLNANTAYTVSVRAICGVDDTSNAANALFRTTCATISTLPWNENFNSFTGASSATSSASVTNIPCWDFSGLYSNYTFLQSSWNHDASGTASGSGSVGNAIRVYGHTTSYPTFMVLPPFEEELNNLMFTFWMTCDNITSQSIGVGYMTNPADQSSYVEVGQYVCSATGTWEIMDVTFPDSAEGRIAMRYYGNYNNIRLDDFTVMEAPSCTRPIISVSGITSDEATLNLADANNVGNYTVVLRSGSTVVDSTSVSGSSYLLYNLSPNTAYTVSAMTECNDGTVTIASTINFRTACGNINQLPWTENFESFSTTSSQTNIPCWDYIGNGSGYNNIVSSGNNSSNRCYRFMPGSTNPLFAILPPFEDNISGLEMSLAVRAESATSSGNLVIGYITDIANATTFVPTATIPGSGHTSWTIEEVGFAGAPDSARIAIAQYSNSTNYYWWIDDINVHEAPSCTRPTVTVSGITTDEATLTLSDANDVDSYIVVLLNGNTVVDSTSVNGNSYLLDNLSPNTAYTVRAYTDCGDGTITTASTVNFRTACGNISQLPWTENFESYNTSYSQQDLSCWSYIGNGSGYNNIASDAYNSQRSYRFMPGSTNPLFAILPPFEDNISGLEMSLAVRAESTTSSGNLVIGYITDITDATTFVPTATIPGSGHTSWTTEEVGFAGAPDSARIAIAQYSNSTNYYWWIDDINVHEAPDCTPPAIHVTNITADSATIELADANDVDHYMLYITAGTSVDSMEVNGTTQVLSNLTAATTYTLAAYTLCTDGSRTNATGATFTTNCSDITTLPWSEGFASYTDNTRDTNINCWSFIWPLGPSVTSSNGYCVVTSSYGNNDANSLRFSGYAQHPMTAILPPFQDDISGMEMTFFLRAENSNDYSGTSSSPGAIRVGYITNPTDSTTFVQTARFECTSGNYATMTAASALFAGAPSGARIAIQQVNNGTNYWWWIDNIDVHVAPSCSPVNSVAVTGITINDATVTITDSNYAGHYLLVLNGTDSAEINTDTYTYTTLNASSNYTLEVSTICPDGTTTMPITVHFNTPCGAISNLPWTESFEGYTFTESQQTNINCWKFIHSGTASNNYVALTNSSTRAHHGVNAMRFNGNGLANTPTLAVLPEFSDDVADLELTFWAVSENNSTSGTLVVGYLTDTNDASTFVPTYSVTASDATTSHFFIDATFAGAPSGARIAIGQVSTNNYWWWVDELNVHDAPSCTRPTVVVTDITSDSATVILHDANNVNHYVLYTSPTDSVVLNDTVYYLTNLTPNTSYALLAKTICTDGSRTISTTATFRTDCGIITTLPWTEGFESYTAGSYSSATTVFDDNCWKVFGRYSQYYPYVYTSTSSSSYVHGGANSLYIYSYNGANNPRTTMVLPTFATSSDSLYISMWVYSYGTSYGLEFGTMSDPTDTSTFSTTYTWAPAASYTYEQVQASFTGAPNGHIAFRYRGSNYGTLYIDDITVDVLNTCATTVDAQVLTTTGDSAYIDWSVGFGMAGTVDVTLLSETGATLQTFTDVTAPLGIGGLAAETGYQAVVSLNCQGSITASDTVTFSTRCFNGSELEISATTLNITPGSTYYFPFNSYYNHSTTEQIYLADELGSQPMNIVSVSFNYTYSTPISAYSGQIYLKHTNDTLFTTSTMTVPETDTDMQLVYDGPFNMQTGWNEFAFTSSFAYDGVSNLIVAVVADGSYLNNNDRFSTHTVPNGRVAYYSSDSYVYDSTRTPSLYTKRNDVKFGTCAGNVPQHYLVTLATADATMGSVSPAGTTAVAMGNSFTATATANQGYGFVAWTMNGQQVSTDNPYTFVPTANTSLTATFEAIPECLTPTDVTVSNATFDGGTVSWTPGDEDQTNFQVNIYSSGTGSDTVSVQNATTYTFSGLYAGTTYNVRVRAVCGTNVFSEWSQPAVLTTTTCARPTGVNAVANGRNVNVTWDDMGVEQYKVEWYEEGFTTNGQSMTVNTNSATINDLEPGQAYDIYVYAYCTATTMSTASEHVVVEIAGINDASGSLVTLYPNPASTTVNIEGIAGDATVTVVDMNGRTVYSATANDHLTIDLSGYAKGAYFVRIAGERTMAIRKLIVK